MAIVIQHETGVGSIGGLTPEWESLYQQDAARKDAAAARLGASIAQVGQVIREDSRYRHATAAAAQQQQLDNEFRAQQADFSQQIQQQQLGINQANLGLRQQEFDRGAQWRDENIWLGRVAQYEELADAMPPDRAAEFLGGLQAMRQMLVRPMSEEGRTSALENIAAKLDTLAALARKKQTKQEEFESDIRVDPETGTRWIKKGEYMPLGNPRNPEINIPPDIATRFYSDLNNALVEGPNPGDVPRPMTTAEKRAAYREWVELYAETPQIISEVNARARIAQKDATAALSQPAQPQQPPPQPTPTAVPTLPPQATAAAERAFGRIGTGQSPELLQRMSEVSAGISQRENESGFRQSKDSFRPKPPQRRVSEYEWEDVAKALDEDPAFRRRWGAELGQARASAAGEIASITARVASGEMTEAEGARAHQAAVRSFEKVLAKIRNSDASRLDEKPLTQRYSGPDPMYFGQ